MDALYNKGVFLFDLGKFQESIEIFNKVLDIEPDNEGALEYNKKALNELEKKQKVF